MKIWKQKDLDGFQVILHVSVAKGPYTVEVRNPDGSLVDDYGPFVYPSYLKACEKFDDVIREYYEHV